MGKRPADEDAGDCVGELLDQAMDLTARFLSDRADLSASAAFAMNRVCREGPIRLTTHLKFMHFQSRLDMSL